METINKRDLLPVLRNSELADQFGREITVPNKYVLKEIKITDRKSFEKIMNVLRFYMVKDLPHGVYDYVLEHKSDTTFCEWYETKFKDFFFDELCHLLDTDKDDLAYKSAICGYLNLLKYAHKKGGSFDDFTLGYAGKYGHLTIMKYLVENGCKWNKYTPAIIAEGGHIECLEYIYELGCEVTYTEAESAAKMGQIEMLKYLYKRCGDLLKDNYDLKVTLVYHAVDYGHLDTLKYLYSIGYEGDSFVLSAACRNGSSSKQPIKRSSHDYLECVKFLHENGCQWDRHSTIAASVGGNFDCFKYAVDNGAPLTYETVDRAVDYNQLDCLKYAIEHGCRYDKQKLLYEATQESYWKIVQYLESIDEYS